MIAAFFTTLLFAVSAICGHRSSRQIGGAEANFWRVCLATIFLGLWANTFGSGLTGDAFPIFLLSGVIGVGLGDTRLFSGVAPARQPSHRAARAMPYRAVRRFDRMALARHDVKSPRKLLCIAVILTGVAVALAPGDHLHITPREWRPASRSACSPRSAVRSAR